MNYRYFVPILIIVGNELFAQVPKISRDWEQSTLNGYSKIDKVKFLKLDYSNVLSNQLRFEGDPWSTYVGVFGPKNKRIDFHITVSKTTKADTYHVQGKSRLGNNIRDLTGEIRLLNVLETTSAGNIVTFQYKIKEPGDKDGDGIFIGIGACMFYLEGNKPYIYWSESGEFREFNNMFVGIWTKYNSKISNECIFSFNVSGTYTALPYRDNFYKEFESDDECKCSYEIKDEFKQYGWQDYEKSNRYKDSWWNKDL